MFIICLFSLAQLNLTWHYIRKVDDPPLNHEPTNLPFVTLQLPLYNEKYVIDRLLDAATSLDYPNTHLEIQLLDDSDDETIGMIDARINQIKNKGIDIVHLRRQNRIGFKAGALQHGLTIAKGEFIAIFDADFIPKKDFLKKVIPYFKDEKIAMVQTRWGHLNENFNL
ncbi:MAG: glycosyltransferase, partial [Flammeovirgaceae bacterium]|nr:glycosyltransferase [Flammeovirgaceae bacterium]